MAIPRKKFFSKKEYTNAENDSKSTELNDLGSITVGRPYQPASDSLNMNIVLQLLQEE